MDDLEKRILAIEERNKKVELDKAWETGRTRKIIIAILTYATVVVFFFVAELPNPFINSIVPTVGFILSTFSLSIIKDRWIKNRD
jgi:hypothetical protein